MRLQLGIALLVAGPRGRGAAYAKNAPKYKTVETKHFDRARKASNSRRSFPIT